MIERLKIYLCARRLQLRDKGEPKPEFVKTEMNDLSSLSFSLSDIEERMAGGRWRVFICKQCRENVRIGVKKTNNKAAHWCWRCEWVREMDIPTQSVRDDDDNFLEEHGLRF